MNWQEIKQMNNRNKPHNRVKNWFWLLHQFTVEQVKAKIEYNNRVNGGRK